MEIQCEEEEEEESLCHCWLVTGSPARSSCSWLMELSAEPRQGKSGAVFPFTEAPIYLPTTDGPPGAPGSFAPPLPYALSILHLNQWTGSWAQPPDLQVTSVTRPPSQSYRRSDVLRLDCRLLKLLSFSCCVLLDVSHMYVIFITCCSESHTRNRKQGIRLGVVVHNGQNKQSERKENKYC